MNYEREDKLALESALLTMLLCPHCRQDLRPVAFFEDVWGCDGKSYPGHMFETWHIPGSSVEVQN